MDVDVWTWLTFSQTQATKQVTGDAFEDVLYGSESELDDSDDEETNAAPQRSARRKDDTGGARLRIDGDDPLDLLAGAATRITSTLYRFSTPH